MHPVSRLAFAATLLLACAATLAQAPAPAKPKAATPAAAPNAAGTIVVVDGDARVQSATGASRAVKVGDTVSEGDTLSSARNGEVHVKMQDAGFLVVRPETRVQIVSYRADGGDEDKGVFNLLSGGLRSITGWIGKFNPKSYTVRAGTTTIGIRGTDHETRYLPEGSKDGEAGVYDRVYAGETFIQGAEGSTSVTPSQTGFQPLKARGKARLLAQTPGFFKPGPHEAEIEQKHAQIQGEIAQRREERRKAIAEKQAELEASRAKVKELMKENKASAPRPTKEERLLTQEQRRQFQAQREALQKEMKDTQALNADVMQRHKAIEEAMKTGQVTRPDLAEQRRVVKEKEEQLAKAQASVKQHRKALEDAVDAKVDEKLGTGEENKALRDQVHDARAKRKALEDERDAADQEMKALHKDEARRYHEELKADRKDGAAPPPSPPPAKP